MTRKQMVYPLFTATSGLCMIDLVNIPLVFLSLENDLFCIFSNGGLETAKSADTLHNWV